MIKSSRNKELCYQVLNLISKHKELEITNILYSDPYTYFNNLDMFELPRENALIEINHSDVISFYGYTNAINRSCQIVITHNVPSEIVEEIEELIDSNSDYEDWEILQLK